MKHVVMALAVLAAVSAAGPAAGQQAGQEAPAAPAQSASSALEQAIESSGIVPALEKAVATATPELERAMGELATSLASLVNRIASDRELRTSAARAGRGVAEAAEVVVVEQAVSITEVLRALADRLEVIAAEGPRPD
jgi:hypothetical protein